MEATKSIPQSPLGALENTTVKINNFIIGCPLPSTTMLWCPCPFKNKAYRPGIFRMKLNSLFLSL